jgi:hypothetical protein
VAAIATGATLVTVAAVLVVVASTLRPRPVDPYKPTPAESRAAATTVPIPVAACATFVQVEKATAIAADETAFGFNPNATPAKAKKALGGLHLALANAMRYAPGPMQQRLRNADLSVVGSLFAIAAWHGVVPKGVLVGPIPMSGNPGSGLTQMRVDGYTHLRVAERLLGSTCGGRLAPDAERVLFFPPASK